VLGRNELDATQLAALNSLLAELRTNKFYASRAPAAVATLDEFRTAVPFTFKREIVEDQLTHPPFGTNLTYPLTNYTRFCQTSGTTGNPMRWLDTPQSWNWMLDCWTRVLQSAAVLPGDRIFFAFSFGPFLGFWTGFEAATRMGCLTIPGGGMRSEARLQAMIGAKANVLCCTPTYSLHLAEVAAEMGLDLGLTSIRTIIVAGEPGGSIAGTRNHIEKLWSGAKVVDHHGMTEIGPTSYGCPQRPGVLHVMEDKFLAEVIDAETEAQLDRGSTGELVLTNLGRTGSPLLRYRTGDLVKTSAAERCSCGALDIALEGGILARTDDMVVVRGVNVYPSAVEHILRSTGGVAEYCVEISESRSLTELRLEVEPESGCGQGLAHRIEAALRDALSLRIPVTIVAQGSLPRFEMKAKRWVKV
jgi:phenylacetate-CoA ligase